MSKVLALACLVQANTTQLKSGMCYTACSVPRSKSNVTVTGTFPPKSLTSWTLPGSITRCCIPAEVPGLALTVSFGLSRQHE